MQHSDLLHPEFGFLSPTPRMRRELRIAATSLLFGGIAGAICVSGVVALRHSDRAATEIAEAPPAAASQESEPGTGASADARAASQESHAGTAAPPQGSAEVAAQRSSETFAPAVAPAPAIAPKARVVRIRKAVDSAPIARLPLGRSEAPAAVSPPPADPPLSRQAADAVPAGNDAAAAAPEKAVARSAASEGAAHLSPPKKRQKTVRAASSRRNDIENDSFWREERQEDWRARAAAPADADVPLANPETAVARSSAGVADSSPPRKKQKAVRAASSRRNDIENDPWLRDERPDDWRARAAAVNDARNPAGRAYAREGSFPLRGFWDWSR